jgi:hypothetical protein
VQTSITFAFSDGEHPVPGIDCALAATLSVMHATPVRNWIIGQRAAAGSRGLIVIADDSWVPSPGCQALTFPAQEADMQALKAIRGQVAAIAAGYARATGCSCTCHTVLGATQCDACCDLLRPASA